MRRDSGAVGERGSLRSSGECCEGDHFRIAPGRRLSRLSQVMCCVI